MRLFLDTADILNHDVLRAQEAKEHERIAADPVVMIEKLEAAKAGMGPFARLTQRGTIREIDDAIRRIQDAQRNCSGDIEKMNAMMGIRDGLSEKVTGLAQVTPITFSTTESPLWESCRAVLSDASLNQEDKTILKQIMDMAMKENDPAKIARFLSWDGSVLSEKTQNKIAEKMLSLYIAKWEQEFRGTIAEKHVEELKERLADPHKEISRHLGTAVGRFGEIKEMVSNLQGEARDDPSKMALLHQIIHSMNQDVNDMEYNLGYIDRGQHQMIAKLEMLDWKLSRDFVEAQREDIGTFQQAFYYLDELKRSDSLTYTGQQAVYGIDESMYAQLTENMSPREVEEFNADLESFERTDGGVRREIHELISRMEGAVKDNVADFQEKNPAEDSREHGMELSGKMDELVTDMWIAYLDSDVIGVEQAMGDARAFAEEYSIDHEKDFLEEAEQGTEDIGRNIQTREAAIDAADMHESR